MPRIIFKSTKQSSFLLEIKQISGFNVDKLALLCSVSPRTFRDWLRGKYNISENALLTLQNKIGIKLPSDIEVVNDYWYAAKGARKGALKRMELYGTLGTLEGRRKGGTNSQLRRK